MITVNKIGKMKLILLINIFLVIIILIFLSNQFMINRLQLDLKYGEEPIKLLNMMEKYFQENEQGKKILAIFVFNNIPGITDIENIRKIHDKHGKSVQFYTFFSKKFKVPFPMNFPHKFLKGSRFESHFGEKVFDSNYFIILNDKKVTHIQEPIRAIDLNFLLEKQLHPQRDYSSYAASSNYLKTNIIKKLKNGNLDFLNLTSNNFEKISDFKGFSSIYVIIAECTACELKNMVSDLKLRQILDKGKKFIVFPVQASESQLMGIIKKEKIQLSIYLDNKDHFNLFSIITNPKVKMIIIEGSEIEEINAKEEGE